MNSFFAMDLLSLFGPLPAVFAFLIHFLKDIHFNISQWMVEYYSPIKPALRSNLKTSWDLRYLQNDFTTFEDNSMVAHLYQNIDFLVPRKILL